MSEPKRYNTVKDIVLKGLSNAVSFKYQTGIIVTVAFFTGLLPWFAWLPAILAIAAIRGWERFMYTTPAQPVTPEPTDTEVE